VWPPPGGPGPSLVPWARETSDADAICPIRKPRSTAPALPRRVTWYAGYVANIAPGPATSGDAGAGTMIFCTTWPKWTPCCPAPTHTAPIRPPNNAWEELDGSPSSQVARFR
jgi:hypothetical protein